MPRESTIKIQRSDTPDATPSGLTAGEIAVNLADRKLFVGGTNESNITFLDSSAVVTSFNGITGAVSGITAGGANTFTALNSFSAGISAAGGVTFASDIRVNSITVGVGNDGGGAFNTAVGYGVLRDNTGSSNVALGYNALVANTTGNSNEAVGYSALSNNISGNLNVGIGQQALGGITQGDANIGIGYRAGLYTETGSILRSATDGIYIGQQAKGSTNGQTNEIVIGRHAVGLGSNTTVLGATSAVSATIYGTLNAPSGISANGATFSGNIFAPNIVNSFNGSTGAVSGITAGGANTFTALNSFSAGISAAGTTAATFNGTVDMNFNTLLEPTLRYYNEVLASPAISANVLTLDLSTAQVFTVSLNANITTFTITNTPATANRSIGFTLIFTADGTARTVTWGAAVKWANNDPPALTSANGKKDILSFVSPDAGTTWYGFIGGLNF